jgi:hypothetical protein
MNMTERIEAYPLTWPQAFPRATSRLDGNQFRTTLAGALSNVEKSIARFSKDSGKRIESLVISSNVTLGQQRPADPGVAVWFVWDGLQVCIPIDRYKTVEANLQAIHLVIEARRTELRHGGLAIVRATFTGFKALPAPGKSSVMGWRQILGVNGDRPPLTEVEAAYKKKRSEWHPDKPGGDADKFDLVQRAFEQAKQELQAVRH